MALNIRTMIYSLARIHRARNVNKQTCSFILLLFKNLSNPVANVGKLCILLWRNRERPGTIGGWRGSCSRVLLTQKGFQRYVDYDCLGNDIGRDAGGGRGAAAEQYPAHQWSARLGTAR